MATSTLRNLPSIVEQGTYGVWTYRKWSDGTAECWCKFSVTLTSNAQALGGYSYYRSIGFPPSFFTEPPIINYSAYIDNAFALTGTLTVAHTKDDTNLYAISNVNGTKNTAWYVFAIGKWK